MRDVARGIFLLTYYSRAFGGHLLPCVVTWRTPTYLVGTLLTRPPPGLGWRTASCSVKTNPNPNPTPNPTPTPSPNLEDHVVVSEDDEGVVGRRAAAQVPVRGVGGKSSALGRKLVRWRAASKGLGPLPRRRGSALAQWLWQGWPCGAAAGEAAAVSTG